MSTRRLANHFLCSNGLAFPECPRWHDGRLWFSDIARRRVWAHGRGGPGRGRLEVTGRPGGPRLAARRAPPRGVDDRSTLLRLDPTAPLVVGGRPLTKLARSRATTWSSTTDGRAYIGNFGFDLDGGESPPGHRSCASSPTAKHGSSSSEMLFPNGSRHHAPTARTLVVAEIVRPTPVGLRHPARRLRRANPGCGPTCARTCPTASALDAEGAIWVADPVNNGLMRVKDGRRHGRRGSPPASRAPSPAPSAAATGARSTSARGHLEPGPTVRERSGRIEAVRVDVPASFADLIARAVGRGRGRSAGSEQLAAADHRRAQGRLDADGPQHLDLGGHADDRRVGATAAAGGVAACACGRRPSPPSRNRWARCTSGSRSLGEAGRPPAARGG